MNINKDELKEAVVILAEHIGVGNVYKLYISENTSMPEVVKYLSYDLFINQFDYRSCPNAEYKAYKKVFAYAKEMSRVGFVNFI